jgi:hypothetical protein
MSMQAHLAELEKRHNALEKQIETELTHPGSSDLKLSELKRKKLQLKEKIEFIRSQSDRTLH